MLASLLVLCKRILVPQLILANKCPGSAKGTSIVTLTACHHAHHKQEDAWCENKLETPSSVTKCQPATKYYPNGNLKTLSKKPLLSLEVGPVRLNYSISSACT